MLANLKVQEELLTMISDLARDKRSATALEAVFKNVSGLVVGIACSGVKGLLDASMNALVGLACIDPDLIWLLLSDVYYSERKICLYRQRLNFQKLLKFCLHLLPLKKTFMCCMEVKVMGLTLISLPWRLCSRDCKPKFLTFVALRALVSALIINV
ncbi:Hypothetical predicted protein [Olea europaea subsp. europaea]|uniref:Uncharacterized protein n=1 Tax=Olea europaea subsp. europaea TaxID=158383 RepID=A0A8S0TVV7_OLEEU|nr:Hypothetical predicted protein [Olea europaea subsp. europaea]